MPQTYGNLVGSHLVGRKGVAAELQELADRFKMEHAAFPEPVLQRDPENPFHENAINIMLGDMKMGFVERIVADRLAPIMDAGHKIAASFYSFADPKRPLIEFNWEGPDRIEPPEPPPYQSRYRKPLPNDDDDIPF